MAKRPIRTITEIHELPLPAWLTSAEAALYLNTTCSALANLRTTGNSPTYGRHGAFIRYRRGDLDEWMTNPKCGGSHVQRKP